MILGILGAMLADDPRVMRAREIAKRRRFERDRLRAVDPAVLAAFESLDDKEQRRFKLAVGDDIVAAMPIYLTLEPHERSAGLAEASKSEWPFAVALGLYRDRLRRTVADDDMDLL